jgi:hypothetical protein
VLSSEHPQEPQVEFFLKDMAAVQRSVTPWVIVHLHRQAIDITYISLARTFIEPTLQAAFHFVSKGQTRRGACSDVAPALCAVRLHGASLFAAHVCVLCRWEIDFVMAGHVHYYERLCAVEDMYSCSVHRDRPIYIADGSAGAEFDPRATPPSNLTMHKEFSYWGYSRFAVTAESLTFTHYRTDNRESDKVVLPRKK